MALQLVIIDSELLPGIGEAVRSKTGGTDLILPEKLKPAIEAIQTGDLPELTTPAEAGHVLAGKEYIDGNGDKKAGTLVVCDTIQEVSTYGETGVGVKLELESTADSSSKTMTLPELSLLPENIVDGASIFCVSGSAIKLCVETGTITPAEDVKSITIPAPFDGHCALLINARDRAELEAKGADSIYSVRVMRVHDDGVGYIGMINRYNGSTYSAATISPVDESGNISIITSTGRYFRAGIVYNYYVYYWSEDNA